VNSLDDLLREFGFTPEEFPKSLRASPTLLKYAEDLPHELRAEYLSALLEFFQVYTSTTSNEPKCLSSSSLRCGRSSRTSDWIIEVPSLDWKTETLPRPEQAPICGDPCGQLGQSHKQAQTPKRLRPKASKLLASHRGTPT